METENGWTRIRESQLGALTSRWSELAKRADRLHLPRPTLEVGERSTEKTTDAFTGIAKLRSFVMVRAAGEPPSFAGWTLLGTLQHIEGLVIVRSVPNVEIPERYRTADPKDCDHCHAKRSRLNTHVIRHEDGRVMQVGGDCAQYYLPSGDIDAILSYIVALLDACAKIGLADPDEPGFESGSSRERRFDLDDILRVTLQVVRVDGWTSRTKARDGNGTATADSVGAYCDGPRKDASEKDRKWFADIIGARRDEDAATVTAAIEWAISNPEQGDYAHNLRTIASLGWVDSKTLGIACSLVMSYQRALGQIEEAKRNPSHHVGVIGKRQEFSNLQVAAVRYFDSDFGTRAQVQFLDAESNLLVWWTNTEGSTDIRALESAAGNCKRYSMKATVKTHETYKGVAQTVVTRCNVTETGSAS